MITLEGYTWIQQIYEGNNSLIYRGYRDKDRSPIIAKLLKGEYPKADELARFKLEFKLLKKLKGDSTVNAYDLVPYGNSLIILMEYFGVPLKTLWADHPLSLPDFLTLAIQIVSMLEIIHTERIIHKDINPTNILWDKKTNRIKIIDFGIASTLAREEPELPNLQVLEGALPYISPEQTGRMNRGIDYRTDFYSLGVVFYEMLTGKRPFESSDPLQLVHAHIAKRPPPPHELNPDIPVAISAIILKLMAKTAEDRYQSTFGIKTDLQTCLTQLNEKGRIDHFEVGSQDISAQFRIPEKLYGREEETQLLLESFERVSRGAAELMLVIGRPGVGKSRLIHEIHKPIVEKHGYFIAGKFEQFKRNLPYAPLIQAFQGLVQQMLGENDERIAMWREQIVKALGPNGQVILDVIPALTQIIGPQPPLPELGSTETQNRFNLVFQNFVQSLASQDHPLAIFLDDLQWADTSSIKLLEMLLKNIDSRYFLIIGAYRDNEIDALHPLIGAIKAVRQAGVKIFEMVLKPLSLEHIDALLMDSLHLSQEEVAPLSAICFEKTHGNPFFLLQFLQMLYKEQLIEFDYVAGRWNFQVERIQQKGFTDNVVEFMAKKVRELPTLTQNILQLAACLGSTFDVQTLAVVAQQSIKQVAEDLWPALQEGLVLPLDEAYKYAGETKAQNAKYQFLHDRVLQAAYSLASENNIKTVHLTIGRLLLKHTPEEKIAENALDIANHLNMGVSLITDNQEKETVAKLNLIAGQRAKLCVAYEQALTYLNTGIDLLNNDAWKSQYELTVALYIEAAETANLAKEYRQMEHCLNAVLRQGATVLDKAKAYQIQAVYLLSQNRLVDTINSGLKALQSLGVNVTAHPTKFTIWRSFMYTKWLLRGKTTEDIYNEPVKDDPYSHAILAISKPVIQAMYLADPMLFVLLSLKGSEYALKHGTNKDLIMFYLVYGMIRCVVFNDVESGYQFGQLALRLFDKHKLDYMKPFSNMIFYSVLSHWRQPISKNLPALKYSFQKGLEVGDLVAAGNCAFSYVATLVYCGKELATIMEEAHHYAHLLLKVGDYTSYQYVIIFWWLAVQLSGKTDEHIKDAGIEFDEDKLIKASIDKKDNEALCLIYLNKTMCNYLLERYEDAYIDTEQAVFYSELVKGKEFYFLSSLVYLANYKERPKDQAELLKKIKTNLAILKKWGKEAPMNYLHKYYLIFAEYQRIIGKTKNVIDFYNLAIAHARKNGYLHDEALANELAAKYYLSLDQSQIINSYIAKGYMNNAYYCYLRWGAYAKTKLFEEKYSHLLTQNLKYKTWSHLPSKDRIHISASASGTDLDLATIMKAAQAIGKEIVLADVLRKMMQILMENTGAQKGYLLLEKDSHWFIEAEGNLDQEPKVLQSIPMEKMLPISIINYVIRAKKPLVIDDALHHEQFSTDAYVLQIQPKSILCVPLLNQSVLNGILYLENNLTENAFSADRVDLMNLLSAQIVTSIENARLYDHLKSVNEAYYRFVPIEFLNLLKKKNITEIKLGDQVQKEMSVMVCDIRNFTTMSEKMTPRENIDFINSFLSYTEPPIAKHQGFIDKYIGDAIMALFPEDNHADNAIKSAIAMLQAIENYNQERLRTELPAIRIGVGISTGLLMLGTVGDTHRMEGTVISDVVNTAFRVENLTKIYGAPILITENVYSQLKNPNLYCIRKIDTVFVKGKLKPVTIYEVYDNDAEKVVALKSESHQRFENAIMLFQQKKYFEALTIFQNIAKQNPDDLPTSLYIKRCEEIASSEVIRKISHGENDE